MKKQKLTRRQYEAVCKAEGLDILKDTADQCPLPGDPKLV